jgi:hypothetical protein
MPHEVEECMVYVAAIAVNVASQQTTRFASKPPIWALLFWPLAATLGRWYRGSQQPNPSGTASLLSGHIAVQMTLCFALCRSCCATLKAPRREAGHSWIWQCRTCVASIQAPMLSRPPLRSGEYRTSGPMARDPVASVQTSQGKGYCFCRRNRSSKARQIPLRHPRISLKLCRPFKPVKQAFALDSFLFDISGRHTGQIAFRPVILFPIETDNECRFAVET